MREAAGQSSRGILRAAAGRDKFALARYEPCSLLQPFIDHYWIIRYNVAIDQPYSQTVLSYPNVHLAFEQDLEGRRALLYGIPKRPFMRELRGPGLVFGVRFRSGGFQPFWRKDISLLTGSTIAAAELFGEAAAQWMSAILDAEDDAAMTVQAETALLSLLPDRDGQSELAAHIVQDIMYDRSIVSVEQIAGRYSLSIRQLQRLFRKYVGVTPKWVIRRFRLQEAAERIEQDNRIDWADLASELGYYDQSHLIQDFRSVLGQSPSAYRKDRSAR